MSLRDYFAAKAMHALYLEDATQDQIAKSSYEMADAMLREREAKL